MNKDEILKGIESYGEQKQQILDAISKHGGELHQDEFDKEFGDWCNSILPDGTTVQLRRTPTLWHEKDESFILGNIIASSDWQRYLHLAQLMAGCELITITGTPPNVTYSGRGVDAENCGEIVK